LDVAAVPARRPGPARLDDAAEAGSAALVPSAHANAGAIILGPVAQIDLGVPQ